MKRWHTVLQLERARWIEKPQNSEVQAAPRWHSGDKSRVERCHEKHPLRNEINRKEIEAGISFLFHLKKGISARVMSPRSRCLSRSREALCVSALAQWGSALCSAPHLQELLLNKDSLSSPSALSAAWKTLKSDSRAQAMDLHLYSALYRSHILTDARHVSSSKSDDKTSLPLYLPNNGCALQSIISIILCIVGFFKLSTTLIDRVNGNASFQILITNTHILEPLISLIPRLCIFKTT